MNDRIADTRQCPYCRQWIPMPLRRQREAFEAHKLRCYFDLPDEVPGAPKYPESLTVTDPDERAFMDTVADRLEAAMTIKRPDLWGNVTATHQTEAELNGFRASQGALL